MITNALAWFAGQSGELRESLVTGATPEITLPASSAQPARGVDLPNLVLRVPHGDEHPLPAGAQTTTIGPLDQAGIWSIAETVSNNANQPALLELACNIANRAESDLRPAAALTTREPPASLAGFTLNRPLWFYLVVLAWLLAALEWFLYQRRWIT